jgi:ATP-dependent Clp protease ATP-binding subunit ClpA
MFERFTQEAREVVVLAQGEARALRHPGIGTEHLLLALLGGTGDPAARVLHDHGLDRADMRRRIVAVHDPDGLDQQALATLGIDLDQVREAAEAAFGPGALDGAGPRARRGGHIPFSAPAKKVLELSLREAVRLKQNRIGTGHILLGLLREGSGLAARVLAEAGADVGALRADTLRIIAPAAA